MKEIKEEGKIRYTDEEGKTLAEIDFPAIDEKTVLITHTSVDDSLRGQGIAKKLVEEVLAEAKKDGKKIQATCSYARAYFEKNPDPSYEKE
jgi:predicted GNAT family acetyltransferase